MRGVGYTRVNGGTRYPYEYQHRERTFCEPSYRPMRRENKASTGDEPKAGRQGGDLLKAKGNIPKETVLPSISRPVKSCTINKSAIH